MIIIAGDEGLVDLGVLEAEVLELEEDPEVLGRGLLVPGLEVEHVDDPRLVLVGLLVVGGLVAEGEDVDEPVDGEAVADDVLAFLVVQDLRRNVNKLLNIYQEVLDSAKLITFPATPLAKRLLS